MRKPVNFEFKPVSNDNWPDLEKLFESKGGPHNCWCMVWRKMDKYSDRSNKHEKKKALKGYIDQGQSIGFIGYNDHEPIAWCSVAPRETYRNMGGDPGLKAVWTLVCFFINSAYRQQGLTEKLILKAVEIARVNGAAYLEAFPVEHDSPSYRFMGFISTFEALGFKKTGKAGLRRHIMVCKL